MPQSVRTRVVFSLFPCCGNGEDVDRAEVLDSEEVEVAAPAAAPDPDEGLLRVNPVIRTYLHPGDATSKRRYLLLMTAVSGAFIWWLGPVLGIFVVDPLIQLLLLEGSVVTPSTDCADFRLPHQVCSADIYVDYYFWNITNAEQWASGAAPPAYRQVGPFAFKAKEVRYNMQYSDDWSELAFTYHQWAELQPEKSCAGCTLDAQLTGVNRGYLQFLAAPSSGPLDPESAVIYQLMPITLSVICDSMRMAIAAANPASTTIDQDVVKQWTDCSFLLPLQAAFGLPDPYLKDVPLPPGTPGFPYNPELCAFIPPAAATLGLVVTPAQFAAYGLAIDHGAAGTFLSLSIGNSNSSYLDPAAAQFLGAFLTMPRAAFLATMGAINPAAATSLGAISVAQWPVVQGYLASLVPSWGSLVFSQWLAAGGGGMIVTKSVDAWMNGFEDPLLLAAAQGAAAAAGAPEAYRLMPWTYTPAVGLSFSSQEWPLEYFTNVTGEPYNYSMLSYRSTDVGSFMPLIQQKRMATGRAQGSVPQDMLQYRGLPFANKTHGIINVTGIAEGVAFGSSFDPKTQPITWDSVMWRPVQAQYAGYHALVKHVDTLLFNMTPSSVAPCNWTTCGDWALSTGFDPAAYHASVGAISPSLYWDLMSNDTSPGDPAALTGYLQSSALHSDLGRYYSTADVSRDRCANPDLFSAMWDMSSLLACPTVYTFPHFFEADPFVVNSTGANESTWCPNFEQHGYALAIEPFTGYAIQAQKTYQVNHLVTRTANLFPQLWVANGTGAAAGMAQDFVTVPVFWVRMHWEPTTAAALLIRVMAALNTGFYYLLVVCWPVLGWLQLGPALFILRFGRVAKARRKAMKEEQRSRARPTRLSQHERAMVAGLESTAGGGEGGALPAPVPEGQSEVTEADAALDAAEGGASVVVVRVQPLKGRPSKGKEAAQPLEARPSMAAEAAQPRAPTPPSAAPSAAAAPSFPAGSSFGAAYAATLAAGGGAAGRAWERSPRVASAKVAPAELAEAVPRVRHTTLSVGSNRGAALLQGAGSSAGSEAALLPEGGAASDLGAPPPSRLGRSRGEE